MSGSVTITIVARESCSRVAVDPENAADRSCKRRSLGPRDDVTFCPRQAFVCLHEFYYTFTHSIIAPDSLVRMYTSLQ